MGFACLRDQIAADELFLHFTHTVLVTEQDFEDLERCWLPVMLPEGWEIADSFFLLNMNSGELHRQVFVEKWEPVVPELRLFRPVVACSDQLADPPRIPLSVEADVNEALRGDPNRMTMLPMVDPRLCPFDWLAMEPREVEDQWRGPARFENATYRDLMSLHAQQFKLLREAPWWNDALRWWADGGLEESLALSQAPKEWMNFRAGDLLRHGMKQGYVEAKDFDRFRTAPGRGRHQSSQKVKV